jgi:hypothetical protein
MEKMRMIAEVEKRRKADEIISNVEILAKYVQPLNNSRFIKTAESTWVYPEPLKTYKKVPVFTSEIEKNVIVNLNLPMHYTLYKILEPNLGFRPRHGSSEENFKAAYSRDTREYWDKVLSGRLYTGEIARIQDRDADFRRVFDAEIVNKPLSSLPDQVLVDVNGNEIPTKGAWARRASQVRYKVGETLKHDNSLRYQGCFDNFNIIPTSENVKPCSEGSKGYCGPFDFNKDFVAVQSYRNKRYNFATDMLNFPLDGRNSCLVPIWTDKNPKK